MTTTVHVFDPAMCCSTGICGPAVEPELVRFAADLAWLAGQGVQVERFNLAQQPAAFVANAAVKAGLEARGEASLPLIEINGEVRSSGTYPSRDELASWTGVARPVSFSTRVAPATSGCCGSATADAPAVIASTKTCC